MTKQQLILPSLEQIGDHRWRSGVQPGEVGLRFERDGQRWDTCLPSPRHDGRDFEKLEIRGNEAALRIIDRSCAACFSLIRVPADPQDEQDASERSEPLARELQQAWGLVAGACLAGSGQALMEIFREASAIAIHPYEEQILASHLAAKGDMPERWPADLAWEMAAMFGVVHRKAQGMLQVLADGHDPRKIARSQTNTHGQIDLRGVEDPRALFERLELPQHPSLARGGGRTAHGKQGYLALPHGLEEEDFMRLSWAAAWARASADSLNSSIARAPRRLRQARP